MTRHKPLLAIFLMILATILFPTKDGIVKTFGGYYSPIFVLWAQYVVMYLVVAPVAVAQHGAGILVPRPFGLQLVRGVSVSLAIILFYWAVTLIPLADATATTFIGPLVAAALSVPLLKEQVGWRRWTAIIIGFAGVLIILRPEFSGERLGYFVALGTGISLGVFYVTNRKLSVHAPQMANAAHSAVFGAVILLPVIPFLWVAPRSEDAISWGLFFLFSTAGQIFAVAAFRYGPAAMVALFQYAAIITATAFGFLVFGDFPDAFTWAGIAIIVASGMYVALRERRAALEARKLAV